MTASVRTRRRRSAADPDSGPTDWDGWDDDFEEPRPPRRWPVGLVLGLIAVLAVIGVYVVWFSPFLAVTTIQVQGPGATDLASEVGPASGVSDGTPMISVDTATVQQRVAAVSAVASVTVTKKWPHTVIITVTERTAVAATQANGQWWRLDRTGQPFGPTASQPADLLPISLATPKAGDPATLAALGVLSAVHQLPAALREQVTGIVAPSTYDVQLTLTGGRTVIWGENTDTAAKIAALPIILTRPGHTYDISDPTLATVH